MNIPIYVYIIFFALVYMAAVKDDSAAKVATIYTGAGLELEKD